MLRLGLLAYARQVLVVHRLERIEVGDEQRRAAERGRVVDQLRRFPSHRADGEVVETERMRAKLIEEKAAASDVAGALPAL